MKEPGRKITSLRILPPGSFFICLIWLVPLSLVPIFMLFCIQIAFFGGGISCPHCVIRQERLYHPILCIYRHGGNVIIP